MTQDTLGGRELLGLILESCSVRSPDYTGLHDRDEFNAAAGHVRDLIVDSITLLRAVFLPGQRRPQAPVERGHGHPGGRACPHRDRGVRRLLRLHDARGHRNVRATQRAVRGG